MTIKDLREQFDKFEALCSSIEEMKSIVVAFSGGVDSTFLIRVASELLGDQLLAVTIQSPYIANWELDEAKELSREIGFKHVFLKTEIPSQIQNNPPDRCYLCKKEVFTIIKNYAQEQGYSSVCDGSNADDLGDYRPGMRALRELEIKSPLLINNITKAEIRMWSKALGLCTWDKPAYACLLTRLPYHTPIEVSDLDMIESAERFLIHRGYRAVRVRKHGELARVEVDFEQCSSILDLKEITDISKALKALGFNYVTLDMEGYTMGRFNQDLTESEVVVESKSN